MKKILILFILVSFCTGCAIYETKDMKISELENLFLVKDNRYNQSFTGYRFYLPIGIKNSKKVENTFKLSYKNTYMYLYVDLISYLNKTEIKYKPNSSTFYSKKLKNGFLEIKKLENNEYSYIMVYNYGRIEGVVESKNLNDALSNSMIILSSIKYNDKLLNSVCKKDNERAKNFDFNNNHQKASENIKKEKSEDDLKLNFR